MVVAMRVCLFCGEATMGLEGHVIGEDSVTTTGQGGKAVTVILSATQNRRFYGPNSVFKRHEGCRIPPASRFLLMAERRVDKAAEVFHPT